MAVYMLTIVVNSLQEDAIKNLFHCRGWKYEKSGVVPVLTENVHSFDAGEQSAATTRNLHQTASVSYLEQQPQCPTFENAAGASKYDLCDKAVLSTGLRDMQYSMLDRNIDVHSTENSQVFLNNQVDDLPVSVSQHSKIGTHNINLNPYPVGDETGKQYCKNSQDIRYLNIDTGLGKSEAYMNVSQTSEVGCLPPEIKNMNPVDIGYSVIESTKEVEVTCKDLVGEGQYNQLTETSNKHVEVEIFEAASTSHPTVTKDALSKTTRDGASFVGTDTVDSDGRTETGVIHGYNLCSRLKESIFPSRYTVTDHGLQRYDEKWLLYDFEILCEFVKNLSSFEFDRKTIQPKLKEIFEVLKYFLEESLSTDTGQSIQMIGKSSLGEEKEFEKSKTDTSSNITNETDVCDNDNKIALKDEVASVGTGPDAPGSYADKETVNVTTVERGELYKAVRGKCKKILKIKERKIKPKGLSNRKRTKKMKQVALNGHETNPDRVDTTDRCFLKHGIDSSEINAGFLAGNEAFKVKKTELKQTSMEKKQILYLDEEKGKSENKNGIRKEDPAKFRWTVNRNRRMHKYHRRCDIVPPDLDSDYYSAMEKGFYCPDCGFIFTGKNKLILHKRLKGGYCLPECIYCDADDQKDVFQCSKCPKCFQTKEMLERHEEKHSDTLRCSLCEAEFYAPKDLKVHMQTEHAETVLQTFLCDLCGAKFKERKVLNAHQKFVHSDDRPEVCSYCKKCFKTKSQLKNHLITHKKVSELNLSCEICGKMFLRVATLKDHVRRHKKEFLCFCTICNKGFYRRYGLEEHMRVHTGDKPFDCKLCGFKCALSCNLMKHMRVHQKYNAD